MLRLRNAILTCCCTFKVLGLYFVRMHRQTDRQTRTKQTDFTVNQSQIFSELFGA